MEFKDYLLMPIKTKVANFADKAEKAIAANYNQSFGIGNQKIKVYSASNSDNSCVAMLTISGVWMWHDEWWGGRDYEVKCTAENIFNLFVKLIECDVPDNTMECALFHFLYWCKSLPGMEEEAEELEDYLRTTTLQKHFPMKKCFNK